MSEFDDVAPSQENNSNSVDNGFEKLDALNTPEAEAAENYVSSTQSELSTEVDDGDSKPSVTASSEDVQPQRTTPQERSRSPSPAKMTIDLPTKKTTPNAGHSCLQNIDPRVLELVYWRDLKKSGVVFGSMLVLLLSLALFSVLSVVAYLSIGVLTVTTTFVIYKKILGAVQKQSDAHPFKDQLSTSAPSVRSWLFENQRNQPHPFKTLLDFDVSLPEERLHDVADTVMTSSTATIKELRRLFLVEDLVDSLKFGLLLWVLTYFGAWFNGMTLIILIVVGVFTIPKFYETYQVQIDQKLGVVQTKVGTVITKLKEKLPMGMKKKNE